MIAVVWVVFWCVNVALCVSRMVVRDSSTCAPPCRKSAKGGGGGTPDAGVGVFNVDMLPKLFAQQKGFLDGVLGTELGSAS